MSYYGRLLENVRARCPGVLDSSLTAELWSVLDEAFRQGLILVEETDIALNTTDTEYTLIGAGGFNHRQVVFFIEATHPTYGRINEVTVDGNALILPVAPTATDVTSAMMVKAATALDDGIDTENEFNTELGTDFFARNFALLEHGLLSRLMSQPAKPYTHPTLALFHRRSFTSSMLEESHRVRTGGNPNVPLWTYPRWTR